MVPILGCCWSGRLGWWLQLVLRGEMGSGGAGQPADISLCLKSMETFDDTCSQGSCGPSTYRPDLCGVSLHALDPNAGFCRTLLAHCRKAWPSLQQIGLEWSLHLGARWHVAWPLLLAAVTLPGEAVLLSEAGCQGRWICSCCCNCWKGSSVASLLDRAAFQILRLLQGFAQLGILFLERKACRMDYGVGMKLLVLSLSQPKLMG